MLNDAMAMTGASTKVHYSSDAKQAIAFIISVGIKLSAERQYWPKVMPERQIHQYILQVQTKLTKTAKRQLHLGVYDISIKNY